VQNSNKFSLPKTVQTKSTSKLNPSKQSIELIKSLNGQSQEKEKKIIRQACNSQKKEKNPKHKGQEKHLSATNPTIRVYPHAPPPPPRPVLHGQRDHSVVVEDLSPRLTGHMIERIVVSGDCPLRHGQSRRGVMDLRRSDHCRWVGDCGMIVLP
jgi:hypothetical protein